jgi:hypothetical protein
MYNAMKVYECILEIETEGGTQTTQLTAPRIMIENHFLSLLEQAIAAPVPVMIKLSRVERVWSQYDNQNLNHEYYIQFKNNHYIRVKGDGDCESKL